jgi:hypothetical protein
MESLITLIVVLIMPLWIILWWIPRCDAIGTQKAKDRAVREATPTALAYEAASSPSQRSNAGLSRAQTEVLG